jgi:hypothetical protein
MGHRSEAKWADDRHIHYWGEPRYKPTFVGSGGN